MTQATRRLGIHQPAAYRIVVEGWISDRWQDWLNGMTLTRVGSKDTRAISTLQGSVADQAGLLGLLIKLYNLGFPLLTLEEQGHGPTYPVANPGPMQRQQEEEREGGSLEQGF